MAGVRVVADSSVCLPKELIEQYNIELVPETIIFGTKVYRDGVDLVPQDFYVLLWGGPRTCRRHQPRRLRILLMFTSGRLNMPTLSPASW
ncbi:hypothetical protein ES703_83755 [subsurface metagenome]